MYFISRIQPIKGILSQDLYCGSNYRYLRITLGLCDGRLKIAWYRCLVFVKVANTVYFLDGCGPVTVPFGMSMPGIYFPRAGVCVSHLRELFLRASYLE